MPARRFGVAPPDGSSSARSSTASRCFTTLLPAGPTARRRRRRVDLREPDPHVFDRAGRQVLADEVGAQRQLAVTAVDEHCELDGPGPAELEQRVERGAGGAAREEHVVDEHDDHAR